jgi:putative restriction endonuclease
MNDLQRRLLTTQYRAPHRSVTATQLAELAGVEGGYPTVNIQYGRLGHMFCEETGFRPDKRRLGTYRWWAVWSRGYSTPQGFVWEMLPEVAEALELLGWLTPGRTRLAEEVSFGGRLLEGAVCRITVNAYERNPRARDKCIEHYGPNCSICGFNFGAVYGPLAEGFTHVHHLKPLSEIGSEYEVDPVADLRPVCPNCHAVIHLDGQNRSIEEVRALLSEASSALPNRLLR